MKKLKPLLIGDSPVLPPQVKGKVQVKMLTADFVRKTIAETLDKKSFCTNQKIADWLGVPVNHEKKEFQVGQEWIGIMPIRNDKPIEKLKINNENFVGWLMTVHELENQK